MSSVISMGNSRWLVYNEIFACIHSDCNNSNLCCFLYSSKLCVYIFLSLLTRLVGDQVYWIPPHQLYAASALNHLASMQFFRSFMSVYVYCWITFDSLA